MISRAYKTQMYPSPAQERFLFQWLNSLRGIWNTNVRDGIDAYISANRDYEAETRWEDDGGPPGPPIYYSERVKVKRVKMYQTYRFGPPWMRQVPASFVAQSERNMERAWKNFFEGKGGRPQIHKKKGRVSGSVQGVRFEDADHIVVPASNIMSREDKRLMRRPIRLAQPLRDCITAGRPGRGKRGKSPARPPGWIGSSSGDVATISYEGGKWFVSFPTKDHHAPAPRDEQRTARGIEQIDCIGVDVNCGAFVCSDGTRYEVPESLRRLDSLIEESHRALARCVKGSKRRQRAKETLNRRYARQVRIREDWLDKITYDLILRAKVIVLEDIKTKNLTKSAKGTVDKPGKNVAAKAGLNRSILRASFYKFRQMLAYKAEWYGGQVALVNPAYTSQECSCCHARQKIKLSKRTYRCKSCGLVIDRDLNASINIRNRFLRQQAQEVPGASRLMDVSGDQNRASLRLDEDGSTNGASRGAFELPEGGDTNAGHGRVRVLDAQLPPPIDQHQPDRP